MSATVRSLVAVLESLAPLSLAEPWDNVGLLWGDEQAAVARALCCIDLSRAVLDEASANGCAFIMAYHPPIFSAMKRVPGGSLVFDAIRRGIAVYSPHTALDVAAGGTNDVLAAAAGIEAPTPLRVSERTGELLKLVVFVPEQAAQRVRDALFSAGAGGIGHYSECSFSVAGTGTFKGDAESRPAVGTPLVRETVAEQRLELLVPLNRIQQVAAALRRAHPYEEPACDWLRLSAVALGRGMGRVGNVPKQALGELCQRLGQALSLEAMAVVGDKADPIKRVAVLAGAGSEFISDAIAAKCDVLVTGEVRHHDALKAASRGLRIVALGHSNSERAALVPLANRLSEQGGVPVDVAVSDRDPLRIVTL